MFKQLCAGARRKLGQLRFWVLSQCIGVELACLPAGKLLLVPFGDGEGEPSLGSGLPTPALACRPAGRCVWLLAAQVTPACPQSARDGNARRNSCLLSASSHTWYLQGAQSFWGLCLRCALVCGAWGSSSLLSFTKVSSYRTEVFLWPQVCMERSNVNSQRCLLPSVCIQYPCVLPMRHPNNLHP